jgi:4-amino-4-deoxy-L-arabinose transferase-like glycosyltransferase
VQEGSRFAERPDVPVTTISADDPVGVLTRTRRPSPMATRRLALVALAVAVALAVPFLARLSLFTVARTDDDDGVYLQTAWSLGLGHELYSDIFHSQPPLFIEILGWPYHLVDLTTGSHLLPEFLARLQMTMLSLLLVASVGLIGYLLAGRRTAAVAALCTCLVPSVQFYSSQFGADLPATSLAAAALAVALWGRLRDSRHGLVWALAGALVAGAVMIKLSAALVGPAIALVILLPHEPSGLAATLRRLRRQLRPAGWLLGSAVGLCLVTLMVLQPPAISWGQVVTFHTEAWDAMSKLSLPQLLALLGPDSGVLPIVYFVLVFGAGVVASGYLLLRRRVWARGYDALPIAVWALSVLPFLAFYRPLFGHHLVMFVPASAIAVALAVNLALSRRSRGVRRVPTSAVLGLAALCLGQAGGQLALDTQPRNVSMRDCLETLPQDRVIVTDDQGLAARAGLRTPPWLVDTSQVRLYSGWLPDEDVIRAAQGADAVLFGPENKLASRPALLAWARTTYPAAFDADGYELRAASPEMLARCSN